MFDNKKYGNYNLIVNVKNTKNINDKVVFYLKIFANNDFILEELNKTQDYKFVNSWTKKTFGGPYFPNKKNLRVNPYWCLNP